MGTARTICHGAKRWLREDTVPRFNLVILRHTIRNEDWWRKGLVTRRRGDDPRTKPVVTEADANKARCMRHLLINTKPPADWLVAVRTFTSVVDGSRTSLYRFSKRRFRSNFGPPACLPASPRFAPIFLSFFFLYPFNYRYSFAFFTKFLFKKSIVIVTRYWTNRDIYPRVCRNSRAHIFIFKKI